MIKRQWERIPRIFRNRYAITIIAFGVWMLFFDQNNLINQIELKAELYQLKSDKEYYQSEIATIKEDLKELLSDDEKLEKFAREKYFMKKENEDIFLFVSEDLTP
ncbi:MAG: septum formation initiator family protein [Salibacteraceae bacterium]